jgi:hypothetical protein
VIAVVNAVGVALQSPSPEAITECEIVTLAQVLGEALGAI